MVWATLSIAQIGIQLSWQKPSGNYGAEYTGGWGAEVSWSFTPRENRLNIAATLGYHVIGPRNDTLTKFVFKDGSFISGSEYFGNLRVTSVGAESEYRLTPHDVSPVVGLGVNYQLISGEYGSSSPEFGKPDWEDNQTAVGVNLRFGAAYLIGKHGRFDLGVIRASLRNPQLSEWQSFWEPYARVIYYF